MATAQVRPHTHCQLLAIHSSSHSMGALACATNYQAGCRSQSMSVGSSIQPKRSFPSCKSSMALHIRTELICDTRGAALSMCFTGGMHTDHSRWQLTCTQIHNSMSKQTQMSMQRNYQYKQRCLTPSSNVGESHAHVSEEASTHFTQLDCNPFMLNHGKP
jgi:hypothetical protein